MPAPSIDDIWFGLELTATGILVVFTALILVAVVVGLFKQLDRPKPVKDSRPSQESMPSVPVSNTTQQDHGAPALEGGISPEVAAVIMAAVAEATTQKIRIHRIRYRSGVNANSVAETSWSRQGRVSIMTSHFPKN
jgi:Na+-transporting methylmalonyl-CoA/oxaloacetate decarboxylase gamma subunit